MKVKTIVIIAAIVLMVSQSGCGWFDSVTKAFGLADTATVIAKTAQIRTSYAVVAADLLEVKRGDRLDVTDQVEFEKVLWYRVKAHDEARTEGWIEAQNVITSEVLDRSKKLAMEFEGELPQATGQLRAASNLRLAPEISTDNVLFKLANGSTFEIMDWKFVPKQEIPDVDDASKGDDKDQKRTKSKNEEIEAAKEEGEPDKLDDKYDIWYQVRLDPSVSPAPAGWLFGRQVELAVPSDISFFQQNNRKFVSWGRLDTDTADKTTARASTPGSWVILTRTNVVKAIDGVEPDFDGILVLAFDKYDQNYYTVWRTSGEVWGLLPLKLEGTGDNKVFTIKMRNADGKLDDKRFTVFKDKNRMKVTPPEDIAQYQQPSKTK